MVHMSGSWKFTKENGLLHDVAEYSILIYDRVAQSAPVSSLLSVMVRMSHLRKENGLLYTVAEWYVTELNSREKMVLAPYCY